MNSNPIISFVASSVLLSLVSVLFEFNTSLLHVLNLYQVMQLFVGYVHLWGFAFMEGCIASAAWL